jgi:hypothetical protein
MIDVGSRFNELAQTAMIDLLNLKTPTHSTKVPETLTSLEYASDQLRATAALVEVDSSLQIRTLCFRALARASRFRLAALELAREFISDPLLPLRKPRIYRTFIEPWSRIGTNS